MNKRILALLLMLTICLGCLGGCANRRKNNEVQESDGVGGSDAQDATESREIDEDYAYLNIECYEPKNYSNRYFLRPGGLESLRLSIPTEWTLVQQQGGGYTVRRGETNIGKLVSGEAQDTHEWTVLNYQENNFSNLSAARYLEKYGTGATLAYRYRFVFRYTEKQQQYTATLTVTYAEVSEFAATKILVSSELSATQTDPMSGVLAESEIQEILILGNSFINYSDVGNILQEMIDRNGKTANVTAISRGYATVKTYVSDLTMMQDIQNGAYDAVFICGFYSADELVHLRTLKFACQSSQTQLVIFPAHNESESVIQSAVSANSDLVCLNWRQEINQLIQSGVAKKEFCYSDLHNHSTALAGYVGAHMIYRALYNRVPAQNPNDSIDASYVEFMLGDYVNTGFVRLIAYKDILYLN